MQEQNKLYVAVDISIIGIFSSKEAAELSCETNKFIQETNVDSEHRFEVFEVCATGNSIVLFCSTNHEGEPNERID